MASSGQKRVTRGTNENAPDLSQIKMEYDEDERLDEGTTTQYQSTAKTENPELRDTQSEVRAQPGAIRIKPFSALAEIRVDRPSADSPPAPYTNGANSVEAKAPNFPQQVFNPYFRSSQPSKSQSANSMWPLAFQNNGMWPPTSQYWSLLHLHSADVFRRLNTSLNCYKTQLRTSPAFPSTTAGPSVAGFPRDSSDRRLRSAYMLSRLPNQYSDRLKDGSGSTPGQSLQGMSSDPTPELEPHSEEQSPDFSLNTSIQPNTDNETGVKREIDLGVDVLSCNDEGTQPGTSARVKPNVTAEVFSNSQSSFNRPHRENRKIRGTLDSVDGRAAKVNNKDFHQYPPHNLKGKFKCKACDYRTSKPGGVKIHASVIHTPANEFRCTHCFVKNESMHHLVHHFAKIHQNEKRWQCQKCGRSYMHQASYLSHKKMKCITVNPYACHKCDFTCKSANALQKHIENHARDVKLPCQYCGKEFKHRTLETHIAVVHGGERKFKCEQCDFASGTKGNLKQHYKKTRHDWDFACPRCNFRSSTSKGLTRHLATHKKQVCTKFVCEREECGMVFQNIKSFKKHQKLHSLPKEKLFFCQLDTCKAMFDTHYLLKLHYGRTKHHRPYQCPECVHRFMKESSLNKHYKVNHEMKAARRQMDAEMNQVAGTSCEKADEDDDGVGQFGMWLGISGFGSELETAHGSSTAWRTHGTVTAEANAFVKSESDVDSLKHEESPTKISESPPEENPVRLPQKYCELDPGSSGISGTKYENADANNEEALEPSSATEISCIPDINGFLECKIESGTKGSDILQRNAQDSEKILTKMSCSKIKEEATSDEENIADDFVEREIIKTEGNSISDV